MTPIERLIFAKLDKIEAKLERRWIGVSEAMQITGFSKREVQRRAKDGRMKSFRVGNKYRFLESDVIGNH
jgi:excisionase family DNA binding protein